VSRIVRLEASNFKRLRAIEITPDGSLVTIRGRNAQGKSSVLDAIQAALGGKRLAPARPVRDGEQQAEIIAELDGLTIRRTFTAKGGGTLVVENADGSRLKSPQGVLDKLTGSLTLDPLAFSRLDPKARLEAVRDAAGVDLGPLDGERLRVFEERTDINREGKSLAARCDAIPEVLDAPAEPVSVAELAAELEAAQRAHDERTRLERVLDTAGAGVAAADRRAEVLDEQMARLRRQLEELEEQRERAEGDRATAKDAHTEAFEALEAFPEPAELAPIRARLASAEEINTAVRRQRERAEIEKQLEALRDKSRACSKRIDEIDAEKQRLIREAKLPVKGLSWSDEGVTLGGIPFEQCSSAEQLRASVALAIAQRPECPVLLVREGSLLDVEGMRLLAEMAEEHGAQVWVEVVGEGGVGVVIEDGSVKGADAATEAAE
jgi:DNA repair exonuclease SbcCD ATPase subunit